MTHLLEPQYQQLPAKALSLREPWASAVLLQGKDIENRTRRTHFRGRICVHTSRGLDPSSFALYNQHIAGRNIAALTPDNCVFGAIIGTVEIVDCVQSSSSAWWMGPWGWVLADPQLLTKPIPVSGQLGLFEWRRNILAPTI